MAVRRSTYRAHGMYVKGYEDAYKALPICVREYYDTDKSYRKGFDEGLVDWKVDHGEENE